ncbi:MAG: hypothetical protein KAT05_17205 [Spirochaetes bacterium]|nr:hypothetical protein [Spirochaetota bacterium]
MLTKNQKLLTFTIFLIILFFTVSILCADERTKNLQSVVLEDFELKDGKPKRSWIVVPNKFGRENNEDKGKSLQKLSWVQAWPDAYFGKDGVFDDGNEKKEYKNSLAVKMAFNRQGYNFVELYPVEEKEGKYLKKQIPFKGRVEQIDMWIWGANYNYNVEIVIMDYRGIEYRLEVGNIKHIGWKNFNITIPNYIPQSAAHIPSLKQFSLIKIVIWTTPKEKVSGAYVYFDHIKYLSDIFETNYDGYNLGNTETVKALWEKGPKAPDDTLLIP